jgi:two-component system phosphate regulon sensor histidine kinase PhoR
MIKHTFFLKLVIVYLLIILFFAGSILIVSYQTIKEHYIETLSFSLKNMCTTIALKLAPMLRNGEYRDIDTLVKELGKKISTRITIVEPDGKVIADSEAEPSLMDNHGHRPEIREALEGRLGQSLRFSRTIDKDMLYVASPIESEGSILGIIRLSLSLSEIKQLIDELKNEMIKISLVIIIISLLFAIIISRSFTLPIKQLLSASRRVSKGDFDVKIFPKSRDDLKELADNFNYMTAQIKQLFNDITKERNELAIILSSIQEGLVVIDRESKIILANDSFKKIVGESEAEGKFYWEVIRSPEVADILREARQERRSFNKEISYNKRLYLCRFSFNSQEERYIILFCDITEMRSLEEVKKEFVINMSHEFKTPLTAIKGFVEAIEEEEKIKNKKYLEIIKRNTERLINITNDLLLLSEIEDKKVIIQKEALELKKILENITKIFQPRIEEKGLALQIEADKDFPRVLGDRFLLEQAFINLIDNAIKYTEKGSITLRLKKQNNIARIEVKDTGIGIPEEHIPRIFERFYVVNKSRSRELGGTGLGLSIVKHIILQHNGKIEIESKPGEGTTFVLILPVKS